VFFDIKNYTEMVGLLTTTPRKIYMYAWF